MQNGDFRSPECIALLEEADIVVTNPPFSLFREFVTQLFEYEKRFLIIGNINCITYKEIFHLIQNNKAWLGINIGRGISGFIVPKHYELYGTEARIDEHGNRIVATNNCLWLTNLDNNKRHENIILYKQYSSEEYPKYDNYDAIEVSKTKDIPMDYLGYMGVPITFLDKYNPEQFEIL
jgi:Adenine-specific methyltransferase EcoRI